MVDDRRVNLVRHADHDPGLVCRPALGYGLCELLVVGGRTVQDAPVKGDNDG